jgi:hypothetical protein
MVKTPASIEHDGVENESAGRDSRSQTESWPGGQEEEVEDVKEVK